MSVEPKFTPGPWKVARTGGLFPAIYGRSKREPICVFAIGDDFDVFKNHEANAHLIAAAPDLYAALYAAEPYFQGEYDYDHPQFVRLRAALAKARGETP